MNCKSWEENAGKIPTPGLAGSFDLIGGNVTLPHRN